MIRFRGLSAMLVGLAAMIAGSGPLAAQSTAPATNSVEIAPPPPATGNAVGPRELQDFSLGGRPARQPEPTVPAATAPAPQQTVGQPAPSTSPARPAATSPAPRQADAAPTRSAPIPAPAVPNVVDSLQISPPVTTAAPVETVAPVTPDVTALPANGSMSWWPWLLAGLAVFAALAFLAWRKLQPESEPVEFNRLAFAGAEPAPLPAARPTPVPTPTPATPRAAQPLEGTINARLPQAAPAPAPAAAPLPPEGTITARTPRSAHPQLDGAIVSRALKPQIEFDFTPIRAELDETGTARLSFELVVRNTGSAPARDLLVEAMMLNAGPRQDEDITHFFRNPVGMGDRIAVLEPQGKISVRSRIPLVPERLNPIEIEGRKLLVPLVAINALYRWTGGDGQQSASFLVGRGGEDGGKMGPFSLDRGARAWSTLNARPHSAGLRN